MRGSFELGLRMLVRCSWTFGNTPIHTACGGQALPLLLSAARCHHLPVGLQTVGGSQETVEYASDPRKQSRSVEVCRYSLTMWAPQAGKMAQQVKTVMTKPDDLSPQDPHARESKL